MSHYIDVTLDSRYGIETKFQCTEPVGARCRLTCDSSCEEWSWDHHAEDYPSHALVDSGECQLVLCANEDESEVWERYGGESKAFHSGEVLLTYQGDGLVEWQYGVVV